MTDFPPARILWTEWDDEPGTLRVYIWPDADPVFSPSLHKTCWPKQISLFGVYPLTEFARIKQLCLERKWRFERYEPYGVPVFRPLVKNITEAPCSQPSSTS